MTPTYRTLADAKLEHRKNELSRQNVRHLNVLQLTMAWANRTTERGQPNWKSMSFRPNRRIPVAKD